MVFQPDDQELDVNSVRSIFVKRTKKNISSLEKSHAVLVTTNTAFAKAAWQYGQQYAPSQTVSTVITDFTLANVAWLKAPLGGLAIPRTQLMAFSYAAFQPSRELLGRYLNEIEKLENEGRISERDLQLLRSSPLVPKELMNLTLGDDELVTEETVTQILERVTDEIKAEEADRTEQSERDRLAAQQAFEEETGRTEQLRREKLTTQQALEEQIKQKDRILSQLHFDCRKRAKFWARVISLVVSLVLIAIITVSQLEITGLPPWGRWSITSIAIVLTVASLYGMTMKETFPWIERTLRTKFVNSQAKTLEVNLEKYGTI